ncbi:uncharacterized protein LOC109860138 [Pseudomyrmex gracilis]|uniref:uncharacterized protein LOC109860138 n=1 Tax=Pseudomyrmex gracilis TaxID=219809 RepID=UPI000994F6F9|nr:uncharacterized protein LOC109860138 [Pseudomyrmex gracilis]
MELYESMNEGKVRTMEQKRTILETIKEQALHHFQIGLRKKLKLIVRSRGYGTLQEAIAGASAEKKVAGIKLKSRMPAQARGSNKNYKCFKCGKIGHYGRECRSSRTDRLPKPSSSRKSRSDNSESLSDEEDNGKGKKKSVSVAELQVAELNAAQAVLDLVTVPMREAKKGEAELLYNTGATVTLIKKKYLKRKTPAEKTSTKLTGVTGHQACVIGKITATIQLKDKNIKHPVYVVRDDFPVSYQSILGNDFIKKHNAKHDYRAEKLLLGKNTLQLRPYKSIELQPRSKTIVHKLLLMVIRSA